MADEAEVSQALVALIAGALYPAGTGNPSATGYPTRIYRGWPTAAALNGDLAGGMVNVTVYAEQGMTRNTSRYQPQTVQTATVAPTVTASIAGAAVTIGGTATAGNVVGVQFGPGQLAAAYAYIVQAGDTLAAIAAALAAKIPGATAVGTVLTLPSALNAGAAVMVPQPAMTEVRRQDTGFRVSCWTNAPDARDATAALIDNAVAGMRDASGNWTRFLTIKPNEAGWIRFARGYTLDAPTKAAVWRRDLLYQVEYPTTLIEQIPEMLFGIPTLQANEGPVVSFTSGISPVAPTLMPVDDKVVAAGTTQATATILRAQINIIIAGSGGVTLPVIAAGEVVVRNALAVDTLGYPPEGFSIEDGAVNAPVIITAGGVTTFALAEGSVQWFAY